MFGLIYIDRFRNKNKVQNGNIPMLDSKYMGNPARKKRFSAFQEYWFMTLYLVQIRGFAYIEAA